MRRWKWRVSEGWSSSDEVSVEGSVLFVQDPRKYVSTSTSSFTEALTTGTEDMDQIIDQIIGWRNLDKLGRRTNIEKMIRPREPIRARRKHNILSMMKDDAQRENPTRTIARAIRAIIGAVYYDGGFQAARRVLSQLDLIIKSPGR
jgi:hypothetical protein